MNFLFILNVVFLCPGIILSGKAFLVCKKLSFVMASRGPGCQHSLIVPVNKCLCAGKSDVMGLVFPVVNEMAIAIHKMHFLGRKSQQKLIISRET